MQKINDLSGWKLNYLVAMALGREGLAAMIAEIGDACDFKPSTDGAIGIQIIERYSITVTPIFSPVFRKCFWTATVESVTGIADTVLLAAMRCFVRHELGEQKASMLLRLLKNQSD